MDEISDDGDKTQSWHGVTAYDVHDTEENAVQANGGAVRLTAPDYQ